MAGFRPVPVGVVSASGPPAAKSRRFAISSVFRTGIGSCNSRSGWVAGRVTNVVTPKSKETQNSPLN